MGSLGLPFTTIPPGFAGTIPEVDETPLPAETPANLVQRLSRAKAAVVVAHLPRLLSTLGLNEPIQPIVIAADTEVALGNEILGKPPTPASAVEMLRQLRHEPH